MDDVALPTAPGSNTAANLKQGGCTVDPVHAGKCEVMPIQLEMPFKFAGDFVYHCHILSHEDTGMMNRDPHRHQSVTLKAAPGRPPRPGVEHAPLGVRADRYPDLRSWGWRRASPARG